MVPLRGRHGGVLLKEEEDEVIADISAMLASAERHAEVCLYHRLHCGCHVPRASLVLLPTHLHFTCVDFTAAETLRHDAIYQYFGSYFCP